MAPWKQRHSGVVVPSPPLWCAKRADAASTLALFDKHLKGEAVTLLQDTSAGFSEASFSIRKKESEVQARN